MIVIPLAFVYAYALTRSRMPFRGLFYAAAMLPLFAPSLLSAISLIYLFGNQGLLKGVLFGGSIYGPIGIVIAQVFYCFPHALIILVTALALADARLYEVADALGTTKSRIFRTVTLPGAKFGLINAAFVVFTLVVTDFGIAKVIGGQFNVLATDAYKQVVGQQNFEMGAVVGMVLLVPAVLAFVIDRMVQRRQVALLSARAVPLEPKRNRARDIALLVYCLVIAGILVGVLGTAVWASFITYWPYNLTPTLKNYDFAQLRAGRLGAYFNSVAMALVRRGLRHRDRVHRRLSGREDQGDAGRAHASRICWRCCRWRCRAWCSASATCSSSMRTGIRSASSTARSRCW